MPAPWLTVISWVALAVGLACALHVANDIVLRGNRQQMPVMGWVWPITALYLGPVAVWGYRHWGRPRSPHWNSSHPQPDPPPAQPSWASTAIGVSHCGAGCTLGDIIAEFTVFGFGFVIAGQRLFAEYAGDYLVAVVLGLVFQYFAIAPMRGLGLRDGIVAAAKADIASLTAFEVGLFGWMALMAHVFFPAPHHLLPSSPVYWFGMQIGMVIGFITAYPVNLWLIRAGIKETM
jgi:hypothetical protein